MFRVPSSTPPSTPGRDSRRSSRNGPSTTPAGPPPDQSIYPSSTPAGPPPAMNSLFGRSQPTFDRPGAFNMDRSLYGSSPPKPALFEGIGASSIGTSNSGRAAVPRGRTTSGHGYGLSSSPLGPADEEDAEGEDDDDMDEDEYDDDDDMDEEDEREHEQLSAQRRANAQNRFSQSMVSRASADELEAGPSLVRAGAKQTKFDLLAIAKGLTPELHRVTLQDSEYTIIATERLMETVQTSFQSDAIEQRTEVLGRVAQDLVALWKASAQANDMSRAGGAAPEGVSLASPLASLLLSLHHPPPAGHTQRTSALSLVPSKPDARHLTPIPKVLLDWLNTTYYGLSEVDLVLREKRGFSSHTSFWEAVQAACLRGNFSAALQLLQGAQLEHAATAQDDGLGSKGYTGAHLRCANDAVREAISLLRECPAVVSDDWDVRGHDWSIFRQRVHQSYINLQDFAEGDSRSRKSVPQPFTASHFGISQSQANFQLSVASRKAESKVPWSIYENLRRLYQLLLGNEEEILDLSADWIEAVLGLTIWWNGEEEEQQGQGSLAASRRSVMRSQRIRSVDVTPVKAYCRRLSSALAAMVENSDEEFSVNTTDRLEVGIACVFDENVEGALQILSSWSITVGSAIAEVASAGEWFTRANGIMDQFDQSDLMVLSYNEQQNAGVTQDDFLVAYSRLLATQGQLRDANGQASSEGWELAIQVLGRLDDGVTGGGRIEEILDDLPLDSSVRVDKITRLCHDLGFSHHALTIALRYADHLRTNTQNYGDTLLYYARAHDVAKIQEVLRVLVAHCLVKSTAYPSPAELDDSLNSLITSPKQTLTKLASIDSEAASMLSNQLSGYATIRKFYDLRDEEVLLKTGEKPVHRPMARRRAAANALMVIIASAASSIRGGLYDPEIETVVQVDVLLPLLGETLIFVNQPKRTLTLRHLYDLLAAIEHLDTAPSMIRTQCEEALSTTLSAAHNSSSSPTNLQNLMQKSTSNLTASSQYSLIGSADFSSANGRSTESSAVLVRGGHVDETMRGWDWRRGFPHGASAEDVLRVLRLGIAKEISRAFAEGEVTA